MSDRELLEMAAKAAGMPNGYKDGWNWCDHGPAGACMYKAESRTTIRAWNPLTDDGDALRLAVKLRLSHLWQHDWLMVYKAENSVREYEMTDPYAATRRAIVRAAAEIGKAMP